MTGIVAAEAVSGGLKLYFHEGDSFRTETVEFRPFVLSDKNAQLPGVPEIKMLDGNGEFCRQAFFSSIEEYEENLAELRKTPGVMVVRDLLCQALSMSGIRLFHGMTFPDLRRVSFKVETADGKNIAKISAVDGSGEFREFSGTEEEIISGFDRYIAVKDPDLLAGFNCCRDDLPLLVKRAEKLKIKLSCGRDGNGFSMRKSRYTAGEKQYSYQRYSLCGRHVADMLHAVQFFDAVHRELEDFEPDTLKEYFKLEDGDGAVLISKLAEILLPASFYRTREVPLGFQETLLRGSGSALDALLIAEYLRLSRAIPLPDAQRSYAGALAGAEAHGVFRNVCHCDVRSLYPSLLLYFGQAPAKDEAGVFLTLLAKLRKFRLEAKDKARAVPEGAEKQQLQALQSSFKILINSFYGYLGFAQGAFNDYDLAEKVTAAGRELLTTLVSVLEAHQAKVIEMDTDGIYFQQPEGDTDELHAALKAALPGGIELEFDACYKAMYSYKAKNYALWDWDDDVKLTGAALKSRALEPFQRKFIMQAVTAKLHEAPGELEKAYKQWKEAISNRTVALADLAKSEVLSDSPENYQKKLASGSGRRSAAYEVALASGRKFRAGDKVRFYVTGTRAKVPVAGNSVMLENGDTPERNENTAYYLAKLDALYEQFK
ncbi:MAG: hypothetical protein IJC27_01970 [Lentisphaeria bacterium]|nr:hypothetical protein [Lentisphaeria bacterium]